MRCGVPYDLFWKLCPKEVYYFIEAQNLKSEDDHFISVQNAWLSASLERSKKIPPLKKLLRNRDSRKKKIIVQDMSAMIKAVEFANMQFGGKDLRKK